MVHSCKKFHLRGGLYDGEFQPRLNFSSLNRDLISSRILSDNKVKMELRLHEKVSSW